jgi:hypothetical protein
MRMAGVMDFGICGAVSKGSNAVQSPHFFDAEKLEFGRSKIYSDSAFSIAISSSVIPK